MIVLTGPGSCLPELCGIASGINARHRRKTVIVRSTMQDVRHLYWASDLMVGTGRVALEAMACQKPVVAIGVTGYSGPVNGHSIRRSARMHFGDHGALAPATVKRIASGVVGMLSDRNQFVRLGRFGRQMVERRFSVRNLANQMLSLYKN